MATVNFKNSFLVQSQGAMRLATGGGVKASKNDPVLVQKNDEGWAPVEKLEGSVSRQDLSDSFALWRDAKKESSGMPVTGWGKKVEREKDGQIQADELTSFQPRITGSASRYVGPTHHVGSEIAVGSDATVLRSMYITEGALENDGDHAQGLFVNDQEWLIN
jgi:hypothetical protein